MHKRKTICDVLLTDFRKESTFQLISFTHIVITPLT